MTIFGPKFADLGLRKFDRETNRKLNQYKKCLRHFIEKRIEKLKEGKLNSEEKKEDYIERMYKALEGEEVTPQFIEDLVDDFSLLYTAGTDTSST